MKKRTLQEIRGEKRLEKEKKRMTLLVLLKSLYGFEIEIELKSEQCVKGTVEEVTENLNVVLKNVVTTDPITRNRQKLELILNIERHLERHQRVLRYAQEKYTRCRKAP